LKIKLLAKKAGKIGFLILISFFRQMNKNLCKLCYHIGHLATDCSPEKKATPEFMHKMRLLIKLYKRKRILDAKDAGLTIVNGNIVEFTKGFNKNKELVLA
jgi:hypothetical protein